MSQDAHQLLGADLLVSADQPINPDWLRAAEKAELKIANTTVFPSMALAGTGENKLTRLVSLKAVSLNYPLRGKLKLKQGEQEIVTQSIPAAGTVWVDPALMQSLQLSLGGTLKLGERSFKVAEVIAAEPDRGAAFMNFAPRVMLAETDLASTKLIQDGSRITYRLLLAGPEPEIKNFRPICKLPSRRSK